MRVALLHVKFAILTEELLEWRVQHVDRVANVPKGVARLPAALSEEVSPEVV